jgi:hypothetical protein
MFIKLINILIKRKGKQKMKKICIVKPKPYKIGLNDIPFYESLCGIKDPEYYSWGFIEPTCKECINKLNEED